LETEDEITVDPRMLYKKFEDMWTKDNNQSSQMPQG
jgi:hypothetical protein